MADCHPFCGYAGVPAPASALSETKQLKNFEQKFSFFVMQGYLRTCPRLGSVRDKTPEKFRGEIVVLHYAGVLTYVK